MKIQAKDKRLVAVAFNLEGKIEGKKMDTLRQAGLKYGDSTQTIVFNDPSFGGQAAFVFEVNSVEDFGIVKRICYRLSKFKAAATSYIRKGVFVKVEVEGQSSVFPVHGA